MLALVTAGAGAIVDEGYLCIRVAGRLGRRCPVRPFATHEEEQRDDDHSCERHESHPPLRPTTRGGRGLDVDFRRRRRPCRPTLTPLLRHASLSVCRACVPVSLPYGRTAGARALVEISPG